MGAVYLAVDPTLERQVAIKLLHRDPSNVGLREEAKVLAALNHKGIVTIHEIDVHDGHDFLVMEYLPGKTLREVLDAGATPRMTLLEICARVADAVAAAHRAGILHRDIKPENILVTDDEVKVLDFGIARRLTERARDRSTARQVAHTLATAAPLGHAATVATAATNTIFGTPAYMAPEVLQGEPSSAASDIYSLGIVVYECVTGRRPYAPSSLVELIAQVIDAPPARLDDPHADLIEAMLAAEPASRPDLFEVSSELSIGRTLIPEVRASTARPRRSRLWIGIAFAAVLGVGATVAWSAREPPPVRIAVERIVIPENLYGNESPQPAILTANLVDTLDRDPSRLQAQGSGVDAAVDYRARVVLFREGTKLGAKITLENVRAGTTEAIKVTASVPPIPSIRLTSILDEVTKALVDRVAPGAAIERVRDQGVAQREYVEARKLIVAAQFNDARIRLESAVKADDKMFDAWYALAFVLGWQGEQATGVAAHARDLAAPDSFERKVMTGVIEFLDGNYEQARAILTPLDKEGEGKTFRREVLYFLGEAWWHDGFFDAGFKIFERALALDRTFRPLLIHMSEYAIVRRDPRAALYVGAASPNYDNLDFMVGNYERVAESGSPSWQVAARDVLGQASEAAVDALLPRMDFATYRISDALRDDEPDRVVAVFDRAMKDHFEKPVLEPHEQFGLAMLTEALLIGRRDTEVRVAIEVLQRHASTTGQIRHRYQRMAILAAGLLRDPKFLELDGVTHRNGQLRAAIQAELADDRAEAVRILQEVLRTPDGSLDLPEHAALIRNLLALGRTKEIEVACKALLRPQTSRIPTIVFQRECATH